MFKKKGSLSPNKRISQHRSALDIASCKKLNHRIPITQKFWKNKKNSRNNSIAKEMEKSCSRVVQSCCFVAMMFRCQRSHLTISN
jgi:hypothetical protein